MAVVAIVRSRHLQLWGCGLKRSERRFQSDCRRKHDAFSPLLLLCNCNSQLIKSMTSLRHCFVGVTQLPSTVQYYE